MVGAPRGSSARPARAAFNVAGLGSPPVPVNVNGIEAVRSVSPPASPGVNAIVSVQVPPFAGTVGAAPLLQIWLTVWKSVGAAKA